jgi:hypothetical protein
MSTYIVKLCMDAGNSKYGALFNVVYFLVSIIACVLSLLAWPLLFPSLLPRYASSSPSGHSSTLSAANICLDLLHVYLLTSQYYLS